jgi:hypothetical protein
MPLMIAELPTLLYENLIFPFLNVSYDNLFIVPLGSVSAILKYISNSNIIFKPSFLYYQSMQIQFIKTSQLQYYIPLT